MERARGDSNLDCFLISDLGARTAAWLVARLAGDSVVGRAGGLVVRGGI